MKKVTSRSALARELIKQGVPVKDIVRRTGLSKQTIYTVKWKMANKQGLGAIKPKVAPVAQGTGITSVPREFATPIKREPKQSNNRRNAQLKRWAREREQRVIDDIIITLTPKRQTVWQRIKGFFGA